MFPFSITYSRSFRKLSKEDSLKILQYIQRVVIERSAANTSFTDNSLIYEGSTSWSKGNIIRAVDKGVFTISENDGESILTYEIFLYELFYFITPASILIGFITLNIWGAILPFAWLGGMNWIIAVTRHRDMFDDINSYIKQNDDQFSGSPTNSSP